MKKFNKLLTLALILVLSMSLFGCTMPQDPTTPPVEPSGSPTGSTPPETLPDPIALNCGLDEYLAGEYGDVYLRINEDFEMTQTDNNTVLGNSNVTSIIIEGVGEDVKFTIKGGCYKAIMAYGNAKITFKNITLVDETTEGGNWDMGWYLAFGGKIRFENCNLVTVIFLENADAEVVNCSVTSGNNASRYGLWLGAGAMNVQNSSFAGTRGIKICERQVDTISNVTISGCTFDLSNRVGVSVSVVDETSVIKILNCSSEGITPVSSDYDEGIDGLFEIGKKEGDYDVNLQISGNKVAGVDVNEDNWYHN